MDKKTLMKYIIPALSVVWLVGVFFMGWKTILWTCIGIALGLIIQQLKENRV